jgi:bacteriocin-like protein
MAEESEDTAKKTGKKADDLLKTSKNAKVELTEEELKRVSGGSGAGAGKIKFDL